MNCDPCMAMAIGVLGSILVFAPTLAQITVRAFRDKKLTIGNMCQLIGMILIGIAFFLQFGFGSWEGWLCASLVTLVFLVLVVIVLRKYQKKDC
ncbi:MAG: hypothetical protein D4R82_05040 [Dehalococcoidia bacterium]|nr:MAG: hypothetical protein D4R82_05040 [Dehalococcoidia bacterium]